MEVILGEERKGRGDRWRRQRRKRKGARVWGGRPGLVIRERGGEEGRCGGG